MRKTARTAVVALGGNALSPAGERSTIADQFRHTRESLGPVVGLVMEGGTSASSMETARRLVMNWFAIRLPGST